MSQKFTMITLLLAIAHAFGGATGCRPIPSDGHRTSQLATESPRNGGAAKPGSCVSASGQSCLSSDGEDGSAGNSAPNPDDPLSWKVLGPDGFDCSTYGLDGVQKAGSVNAASDGRESNYQDRATTPYNGDSPQCADLKKRIDFLKAWLKSQNLPLRVLQHALKLAEDALNAAHAAWVRVVIDLERYSKSYERSVKDLKSAERAFKHCQHDPRSRDCIRLGREIQYLGNLVDQEKREVLGAEIKKEEVEQVVKSAQRHFTERKNAVDQYTNAENELEKRIQEWEQKCAGKSALNLTPQPARPENPVRCTWKTPRIPTGPGEDTYTCAYGEGKVVDVEPRSFKVFCTDTGHYRIEGDCLCQRPALNAAPQCGGKLSCPVDSVRREPMSLTFPGTCPGQTLVEPTAAILAPTILGSCQDICRTKFPPVSFGPIKCNVAR